MSSSATGGGSWRSVSITMTASPSAWSMPAVMAIWCPKLRERSSTRTRGPPVPVRSARPGWRLATRRRRRRTRTSGRGVSRSPRSAPRGRRGGRLLRRAGEARRRSACRPVPTHPAPPVWLTHHSVPWRSEGSTVAPRRGRAGGTSGTGGAALPGAQGRDVVGGGAGCLGGVGDPAQVAGGGQAALEGVEHVDVGDDVAGEGVHPEVQPLVETGVGALPGVQRPLVGLGEVVEGDEDAGGVVLGRDQGRERALPAVLLGAEGQPPAADPAGTGVRRRGAAAQHLRGIHVRPVCGVEAHRAEPSDVLWDSRPRPWRGTRRAAGTMAVKERTQPGKGP